MYVGYLNEYLNKKIERLQERIEENTYIAKEAERQYSIITDQYMNGDIDVPIGREQARLERTKNKALRQIERDYDALCKLLALKESRSSETKTSEVLEKSDMTESVKEDSKKDKC